MMTNSFTNSVLRMYINLSVLYTLFQNTKIELMLMIHVNKII